MYQPDRRKNLDIEQIASILRMGKAKIPPKTIAEKLGLESNTVRVRLCRMRQSGLFELPQSEVLKPLSDIEVREFFQKYRFKSVAQIHRESGHSRDYVTKLLNRWAQLP